LKRASQAGFLLLQNRHTVHRWTSPVFCSCKTGIPSIAGHRRFFAPAKPAYHASVPDLKRFAEAIAAKRLVPVHSFFGENFSRLFSNVERRADGEWWDVATDQRGHAVTESKLPPKSKDNIPSLLKRMTHFANQRAEYAPVEHARRYRYIRVGGDGHLPISLELGNACGGLPGLKGAKKFERLENAVTWLESRFDEPCQDAGNRKTEQRLQAYLMRLAILDPERLLRDLHLHGEFSELRFITDELRLAESNRGEIEKKGLRMDMVFLARSESRWRPLLVELKVKHDKLDSPFPQLRAAACVVNDNKLAITGFLSAASRRSDVPTIEVDLIDPEPRLLAVLPYRVKNSGLNSLWELDRDDSRDLVRTFSRKRILELQAHADEQDPLFFFVENIHEIDSTRDP